MGLRLMDPLKWVSLTPFKAQPPEHPLLPPTPALALDCPSKAGMNRRCPSSTALVQRTISQTAQGLESHQASPVAARPG